MYEICEQKDNKKQQQHTHTHAHTHARTHTRTHARTRTHTHTHTIWINIKRFNYIYSQLFSTFIVIVTSYFLWDQHQTSSCVHYLLTTHVYCAYHQMSRYTIVWVYMGSLIVEHTLQTPTYDSAKVSLSLEPSNYDWYCFSVTAFSRCVLPSNRRQQNLKKEE